MDEEKKTAYIAGFIGMLFGLVFIVSAINSGVTNLSGQIIGILGLFFAIPGLGCFIKPDLFGPFFSQILENMARNAASANFQNQNNPRNSPQVITKDGPVNINIYDLKDKK